MMATQTHQKMGLFMATIVGMNAMIGASIFMIPEQLQRIVGPAALLTYVFVIAAVWCIAYSLARVAQAYPQEGSFYTYVSSWAGKTAGLVAALCYCGGLIVAMGLLTQVIGINMHILFPSLNAQVCATVILMALSASILAGTRMLWWAQIILIILTIAPLLIITLLCLTKLDTKNLYPFMPYGFNAVLAASRIVVFGFFGFEAATTLHNFVVRPEYTVPRAITWSIILVSVLYMGFVASTFLGLPRELFLQNKALPEVLFEVFPNYSWFVALIIGGIVVTIMGTIHALLWSVSELLQSLIRRASITISVGTRGFVIALTILVWIINILFNVQLFFNVASLLIIIAFAGSIVPLAIGKIPSRMYERVIACIGLITSVVMCMYAIEGISSFFFS